MILKVKLIILKKLLVKKYEDFDIIQDIGSGINYEKPGLKELIRKIDKREVDVIVVLHKDRLLRYGYELVEYFAKLNGVEIVVLDKVSKTSYQELVEDLIQMITVFSCRLQGRKGKKTKEILTNINKELKNSYDIE